MGNFPCLRGTSASAGRQHHPPPSRCRGHHSGSAQPPLSHCSPTPGVHGEPPRPRHFVSPRAGGAAAGLGLAAPLRAEPPTEERRRPADAAPQSPTQPGGTAVQPQGTHKRHRERQRLRHDGHLPHHLPALSFIPRADWLRRLSVRLGISRGRNQPRCWWRSGGTRTETPAPIPDPDSRPRSRSRQRPRRGAHGR